MNKVLFTYNDQDYYIQCKNDEKMGNIISKILNKLEKNNNDIIFLYNGIKVNEELTFDECANEIDRDNNQMCLIIIKKEHEIINNNIENNNINNNELYYFMKDKYENFDIKKTRIILKYQSLNLINNMFILRDGRIITNQTICYGYENSENVLEKGDNNKLCIYSIKNNKFICDMNIDYEFSNDCIEMRDGNVIMAFSDKIKIVKIHQNFIEKISTLYKKEPSLVGSFCVDYFMVKYLSDIQPSQEDDDKVKDENEDEDEDEVEDEYDFYLCEYKKGELILYKEITDLLKNENVLYICPITSNVYALSCLMPKKIIYIIFYDMNNDKKL